MKVRGELEAAEPLRRFGSGWISGVLGLMLGIAGLLLVFSLRAPGTFSMPEFRTLHANAWFRLVLHAILLAAFLLSALSLALRKMGRLPGNARIRMRMRYAPLVTSASRGHSR